MTDTIKIAPGIYFRENVNEDILAVNGISEELVVYTFDKGLPSDIIKMIQEKARLDDILEMIVSEYDVSKETAQKDLKEFIAELRSEGILE